MRARAAWHGGGGPEYCRGCAATERDCGPVCPYAANAPTTIEGASCWQAAMLCIVPGFASAHLDIPAALRITESLGVPPALALTLLGALRQGLLEGLASRRSAHG